MNHVPSPLLPGLDAEQTLPTKRLLLYSSLDPSFLLVHAFSALRCAAIIAASASPTPTPTASATATATATATAIATCICCAVSELTGPHEL